MASMHHPCICKPIHSWHLGIIHVFVNTSIYVRHPSKYPFSHDSPLQRELCLFLFVTHYLCHRLLLLLLLLLLLSVLGCTLPDFWHDPLLPSALVFREHRACVIAVWL